MNQFFSENLNNFITPAIFIALLVFLVRFFGRAVSDQKPLVDDRKWEADVQGVFFIVNKIFIPALVVMMYVQKKEYFWPLNNFWNNLINFNNPFVIQDLYLFIFFAIYFIIFTIFSFRLWSFAEMKTKKDSKKIWKEIDWKQFYKEAAIKFFIRLIPIAIIAFLYVVYLTKDWIYFTYSLLLAFVSFFGLAAVESLTKKNIVKVNIYFIDKKNSPVKSCRVVRENSDNIRILKNNKSLIINKSQILKIEKILGRK